MYSSLFQKILDSYTSFPVEELQRREELFQTVAQTREWAYVHLGKLPKGCFLNGGVYSPNPTSLHFLSRKEYVHYSAIQLLLQQN